MNKLQDVKYRELKIIVPEYLYNEVYEICRKMYGKKNYKLKCYELIVREFVNNHTKLIVEQGKPLGKVYRKKKLAKADETISAKIRTTEL